MIDARIEQATNGLELPAEPECRDCRARLTEGRPISVVVEYPYELNERWRFAAAYCAVDAPETIDPSAVAARALVEAELGMVVDTAEQDHWPVVIRPTVVESHATNARAVVAP